MGINFPTTPADGTTVIVGNALWTYQAFPTNRKFWRATPIGTALPFNYFVNPSMEISQENGNTAGTANPFYPADGWVTVNGTGIATTSQRVQVSTPRGSPNRYRLTNTAAGTPTASTNANMQQAIEGFRMADFNWGTSSPQQAVLRFGFKAPAATYSISIRNAVPDRSYVSNFTITAGQANTDTEQVFVIPGDTSPGTWAKDNTRGLVFTVQLANASNMPTAANNTWTAGNIQITTSNNSGFGVINSVYELFDCGLYRDPNKTGRPPPWTYVPDAQATNDAARYYQKLMSSIGIAKAATTTPQRSSFALYGHLRVAPALGLMGTQRGWDQATAPNITGIANAYANQSVFEANYTASSAMTEGRGSMILDASATVFLALNSRP